VIFEVVEINEKAVVQRSMYARRIGGAWSTINVFTDAYELVPENYKDNKMNELRFSVGDLVYNKHTGLVFEIISNSSNAGFGGSMFIRKLGNRQSKINVFMEVYRLVPKEGSPEQKALPLQISNKIDREIAAYTKKNWGIIRKYERAS